MSRTHRGQGWRAASAPLTLREVRRLVLREPPPRRLDQRVVDRFCRRVLAPLSALVLAIPKARCPTYEHPMLQPASDPTRLPRPRPTRSREALRLIARLESAKAGGAKLVGVPFGPHQARRGEASPRVPHANPGSYGTEEEVPDG